MPPSLKARVVSFLRWTERYTKTDMVYLASGGFWSVVGQFAAALIALGLAVVMARYVPKDAYGSYKYILAAVSILGTFSLSGLGTAVFQSVARGYRSAAREGFRANLRWSALVFLGALLGGAYYLLRGNTVFGIGILIGGSATPFLAGFNLYVALFSGEKNFRSLAWYGDVVTNIVPALALGAVAFFDPRPLPLISAYFVANIAAAAYAYRRARRTYPEVSQERDPGLLTYGKHLSAMNILSGIAGNIDQVLLFHFVGPVELAIYNFATAIPDQAKGPMKMLDTMLQARFVSRTDTEITKSMHRKMFWLFGATISLVVLYILYAPLIFSLLFPTYLAAVPFSQVYIFSVLAVVGYPAGSYFAARKHIRAQYISTVANSLIQITLMVVGVVLWGLWGLIAARVFSRILSAFSSYELYATVV